MQPSSPKYVSAFQYEITVYQGTMDYVRGRGETMKEIFIPSHHVIFNSKGFIFSAEKARNVESADLNNPEVTRPLKEVLLPLELVTRISLIVKLKLELSNKEKELSPDLKKLWV